MHKIDIKDSKLFKVASNQDGSEHEILGAGPGTVLAILDHNEVKAFVRSLRVDSKGAVLVLTKRGYYVVPMDTKLRGQSDATFSRHVHLEHGVVDMDKLRSSVRAALVFWDVERSDWIDISVANIQHAS